MDRPRTPLGMEMKIALFAISSLALWRCGDCDWGGERLDLVGSKPDAEVAKPDQKKDAAGPVDLHAESFVVDLIQDLVFRYRLDGSTLDTPSADVNTAKLKAGGVDLLFSAIPAVPGKQAREALDAALADAKKIAADSKGAVEIVTGVEKAREAQKRGAISMMLLLEGADALDGSLDRIPDLAKQGLGIIGLVSDKGNRFADSAVAPEKDGGLTAQGVELLAACRDAGVLIDLTHASPEAFWDALIAQSGAVAVTHSAARALRDHPRNLDDLQILALARSGGVLGLVFNPEFLKAGEESAASLADVVAQIMHVKAIGAVQALALGTDFGGIRPPSGLKDVSKLPALTDAMRSQGLSDVEIVGVLGGNAARLLDDVERERGELTVSGAEILRPIEIDCGTIIGEHEGSAEQSCDGFLANSGVRLVPGAKLKVRLRKVDLTPVKIELFGEPGTPWQLEGQDLDGKVLLNRAVALDDQGRGDLTLPSRSGLTRLFCSPTRPSALSEIVVWGR